MIAQIACPQVGCAAPADVGDRWEFASTDGRIAYARTTCVLGHAFTVPEDDLLPVDVLDRTIPRRHDPAA